MKPLTPTQARLLALLEDADPPTGGVILRATAKNRYSYFVRVLTKKGRIRRKEIDDRSFPGHPRTVFEIIKPLTETERAKFGL